MKSIVRSVLYATCFSLIIAATAKAEVWENIPDYPSAMKIREQETIANAQPIKIVIFKTQDSLKNVLDFYRPKFVNYGWKLMFEKDASGAKLASFAKEDKMIMMIVQSIKGANYISISQSKIDQKLASALQSYNDCPECAKKAQNSPEAKQMKKPSEQEIQQKMEEDRRQMLSQDAPGKDLDFIPRYPRSTRISSMITEWPRQSAVLTYYTLDTPEMIAAFYLTHMSDYNWKLDKEIDYQNLPPQMAKMQEKLKSNVKGDSMFFKGDYGRCMITIANDPASKNGTIIGVRYNGK